MNLTKEDVKKRIENAEAGLKTMENAWQQLSGQLQLLRHFLAEIEAAEKKAGEVEVHGD